MIKYIKHTLKNMHLLDCAGELSSYSVHIYGYNLVGVVCLVQGLILIWRIIFNLTLVDKGVWRE